MKRFLPLLAGALCSGWLCLASLAQDNAARAAAIAEREATEERYKRLNSAVEDLWAAKAEQDRRLAALTEEIRNLRAENSRTDTSKYVTRDELNRLVKTVEEIERQREADKKLILDQFEDLKRDLRSDLKKMLSAPPQSSPGKNPKPATPESGGEKTGNRPTASPSANQEGVWYTVKSGNTLSLIVTEHNTVYNKQGKKTSLKLVEDANPGLKPTSMKVDQKIFIPLVAQ
jgi:septal ring factor EnvC (AmiA/AmiB activator)